MDLRPGLTRLTQSGGGTPNPANRFFASATMLPLGRTRDNPFKGVGLDRVLGLLLPDQPTVDRVVGSIHD